MNKFAIGYIAVSAATILLGLACEVRRNTLSTRRNEEFRKEMKNNMEQMSEEMRFFAEKVCVNKEEN